MSETFCSKCGKQLGAEQFCAGCGAPTNVQPATTATKKANHNLIGMVVCGVVLLIVILGARSLFFSGGYERALTRYLNATVNGNYSRMNRYSAMDADRLISELLSAEGMSQREFNDLLNDEFGVRNLRGLFEYFAEENRGNLEQQLGRNVRHSFEILSTETFSAREMDDLIREIERDFESFGFSSRTIRNIIPLNRINEVVEVRVRITATGRDDSTTYTEWFTMVRIGRNWRVLDGGEMLFGMFW